MNFQMIYDRLSTTVKGEIDTGIIHLPEEEAKTSDILFLKPIVPIIEVPLLSLAGAYIPQLRVIEMAYRYHFADDASYYRVLFHEYAHATGDMCHLNRRTIAAKRTSITSEDLRREEALADLTSMMLLEHFGIATEKTRNSNIAYIAKNIELDEMHTVWQFACEAKSYLIENYKA